MAALGRVEKGVVDCCGEGGSHWFWRMGSCGGYGDGWQGSSCGLVRFKGRLQRRLLD